MARPPRPQIAGGVYHVTARGNRRQEIFTDTRDRLRFLALLGEIVDDLGWRCHAYCLMTNHYHLLLETPNGDISEGMHRLNGVYAKWFNWRHGYEGHLFERRFYGALVEGNVHLVELARYIVLNPVRAGLCRTAGEWRWSSYAAAIAKVRRPRFLTTEWLLPMFSDDSRKARALFADFVHAAVRPP
jgi:REP element-mobilizing transposase RayT